jgi:hypothetical protein
MVPSHRRALRARLLSFRYIDGICLRIGFSPPRLGDVSHKDMAGGTPAIPAALAGRGDLECVM